jgi:FkbM family methyltransferase
VINLDTSNIANLASYKRIHLYGASNTGRMCLRALREAGFEPVGFIDDTEFKIGKPFEGLPTISGDQFLAGHAAGPDVAVVISTTYAKVVLERLTRGAPNLGLFIMFDMAFKRSPQQRLEKHLAFSGRLRDLDPTGLDPDSVVVLAGIEAYLATGDSMHLFRVATADECYFTPEVLRHLKGKRLNILDAGAHDGDLIRVLRKFDLDVATWHCFEPDPGNIAKLLANRETLGLSDVMTSHAFGLWDSETVLRFKLHDGGTNSKIVLDGEADFSIPVKTIDATLAGHDINFVKMDIEGAELNALRGGLTTLRAHRPVLAISIYHSVEDYFDIFEFLRQNLEGYRFQIKQHAVTQSETVLYGFPD